MPRGDWPNYKQMQGQPLVSASIIIGEFKPAERQSPED